jgi:cupin domain
VAVAEPNDTVASTGGLVRRVVTGHDDRGRSVILSDAPTPHVSWPPSVPSLRSSIVWLAESRPVLSARAPEPVPADLDNATAAPLGGTLFRVVDFPPDSEYERFDIADLMPEDGPRHDDLREGVPEESVRRHFWFHKTRTLDYAIVLDGEIWALVDEGETLLRAGDVLIQRGTSHSWSNRSDRPVRMAFVLIDAVADVD